MKYVEDFKNILEETAACSPHLILLDIMLPFFNEFHWCQRIREFSKVPIIFLSSASDNMNIVMAMNMGGDDFVEKAVRPECSDGKGSGTAAEELFFSGKYQCD